MHWRKIDVLIDPNVRIYQKWFKEIIYRIIYNVDHCYKQILGLLKEELLLIYKMIIKAGNLRIRCAIIIEHFIRIIMQLL